MQHPVAAFRAILLMMATVTPTFAAPVPIGEWLFNETGTLANATGSNAALDLTLRNSLGTVTDMHSASGAGVTGLAGDRAFDNRAATDMGSGYSARADISDSASGSPASNALDSLTNMTLTGWFRRDVGANGTGTGMLFGNYGYNPCCGTTGYELYYSNGRLGFISGKGPSAGYDQALSTAGAYSDADSWVFFAAVITGSGSCPSNCPSVRFYKGTKTSAVTLVNTVSGAGVFQGGTPYPDFYYFTVGSAPYFSGASSLRTGSPFDGLLDEMRVYNSAITLSDLDGLRAQAVVPAPAAVWLLASALGVMGGVRRLVRRKGDVDPCRLVARLGIRQILPLPGRVTGQKKRPHLLEHENK